MSSTTVAGEPTGVFSLGEAVATARALIRGTKRHVVLLLVLTAVVGNMYAWALGPTVYYVGIREHVTYSSDTHRWLYFAGAGALNALVVLATTNIGLLRAAGEQVSLGRAFRRLDRLPWLMVAMVPFNMLMQSLYESGSWVAVALVLLAVSPASFLPHFVIDRRSNTFEAFGRSYAFTLANLGPLILYGLLVLGLSLLVPLTLGIGAIWIAPFGIIATAVIYAMGVGLRDEY